MIDFLMTLFYLGVLVFIVRLAWGFYTRCKRCGGMFTRDLQHHEKVRDSPLDYVRKPRERRQYKCEKCGYEWEEVVKTMTY